MVDTPCELIVSNIFKSAISLIRSHRNLELDMIPTVIEYMGALDPNVHEAANTLIFELMLCPGDCSDIAATAIENGFYTKCMELLSSTKPKFIGEVLFSLSNMAAENGKSAEMLVSESNLVDRVLMLTKN